MSKSCWWKQLWYKTSCLTKKCKPVIRDSKQRCSTNLHNEQITIIHWRNQNCAGWFRLLKIADWLWVYWILDGIWLMILIRKSLQKAEAIRFTIDEDELDRFLWSRIRTLFLVTSVFKAGHGVRTDEQRFQANRFHRYNL
jgi:hypothetical protein